jgi:hypothetical protein
MTHNLLQIEMDYFVLFVSLTKQLQTLFSFITHY